MRSSLDFCKGVNTLTQRGGVHLDPEARSTPNARLVRFLRDATRPRSGHGDAFSRLLAALRAVHPLRELPEGD
jgi:hypothetical protein